MFRVTLGLATATFIALAASPASAGCCGSNWGWGGGGGWTPVGASTIGAVAATAVTATDTAISSRCAGAGVLVIRLPQPVVVQAPPQQVIVQQSQPEVIFQQQAAYAPVARYTRRSRPVLFRSGNDRLFAASVLCRSAGAPVSVCVGRLLPAGLCRPSVLSRLARRRLSRLSRLRHQSRLRCLSRRLSRWRLWRWPRWRSSSGRARRRETQLELNLPTLAS